MNTHTFSFRWMNRLLAGLLALALCSSCDSGPAPMAVPENSAAFTADIKRFFDEVRLAEGGEKDKAKKKAHLELFKSHPVCYDWWLQDGEGVDWFRDSVSEQIDKRLNKLKSHFANKIQAHKMAEGASDMEYYLALCLERRDQRLSRFTNESPRVVFTKFHVLRPSFFAYTEGLSDARGERNFIPGGSLCELTMEGPWSRVTPLLEDPHGVFRDPDVHFDGGHVLFAWKKSDREDDFHLYEMDLGTRDVRQLTQGKGHADYEGIYLPDGNIMFNSTRCGTSVDCYYTEVSNLYLCGRDGKYMRRIGFDQVHTPYPKLMDDGRVVYTRWDYNDRGQVFTQPLFQMYPDGTGQSEFYGINSWFPTTISHARQIPGTGAVMVTLNGHHTPQHGKLGIIDPEAGRDENQGVVSLPGKRQPEAERIDSYGQYGDQYQYPYPLNKTELLVSYTPLGYHVGHPMKFGIYWMNHDGDRELLAYDPETSCNQPVAVKERKGIFARTSSVDYTKTTGSYYLQNIYEGPGLEGIEPGSVAKLRIVELEYRSASVGSVDNAGKGGTALAATPVGVGNAAWDIKKVHGTVDVYKDGSAFFRVPARTPLYFQALDKDGMVIQTMRSWTTLQPGEFQSCVGCHENKNTVPVHEHGVSMAMRRGIQDISPIEGGIRGFSFTREIQPILDKHCVSCHDGQKQKFNLTSSPVHGPRAKRHYSESYLNLTHTNREPNIWRGDDRHPEVNWISAMSEPTRLAPRSAGAATSKLIARLKKGHGKTAITQAEIDKIALWIDLLVPYVGEYREANAWSEKDLDFYQYHDDKRVEAEDEDRNNIRLYLESMKERTRS